MRVLAPRVHRMLDFATVAAFALAPSLLGHAATAPLPRPDTLAMFDAMSNGKQPAWVAVLNPVLGVIGVLVGVRMHAGRPT